MLAKDKQESLILLVLQEAQKGIEESNSPFAAALVDDDGELVAVTHNTSKIDCDTTAHAEINLIRTVCKKLQTRNLDGYSLISNAQSCAMCMSAAIKAGIRAFYFGAPNEIHDDPHLTPFDIIQYSNHDIIIETGILGDQCMDQIAQSRGKSTKDIFNL